MPTKETALSNIAALQQPPIPKRRRSATEQALAPLQRRLDALVARRAAKLAKIEEEFSEIPGLERAIAALRVDDDEQAPESE